MITGERGLDGAGVARHYDELDWAYREIWGEHVHHGLWSSGRESAELAARRLTLHVATLAGIRRGSSVCDVGCGYGGTARLLAGEYGAEVTGITLSRAQYDYAVSRAAGTDAGPRFLLGDWLANDLRPETFDAVLAVESTEHMPDLAACFAEAHRVLLPGGRFVICAWLASERARPWERARLLQPICREGRLFQMGTADEYRVLLAGAGFELVRFEDVSARVRRTWSIAIGRLLRKLLRDRRYREYVLDADNGNREFGLSLFRIWLAYRTGAMRYGVFVARKPGQLHDRPNVGLAAAGLDRGDLRLS